MLTYYSSGDYGQLSCITALMLKILLQESYMIYIFKKKIIITLVVIMPVHYKVISWLTELNQTYHDALKHFNKGKEKADFHHF